MPQQEQTEIWGDLFAEVPAANGSEMVAWVPVGQVNRPGHSKASLEFTLFVEPLCWQDPAWVRRMMIVKRKVQP